MNKQVVQFILEDNNPTGIIECTIDEWFGVSYKIPRSRLKEALKLKYIRNTGVYILIGEDLETSSKVAYIGEGEDVYDRLDKHNRTKDFWNECVVFVSENNSLNKAHSKFIEHELYKLAVEAKRFVMDNGQDPTRSSLSGADEIRSFKFIEKIKFITSLFGYRIFDKLVSNTEEDENLLYLKNNGILYAKGIVTDEGFVILKGSKLKEGISEGISKSLINYCERERSSSDIVNGVFIENHLCSSPSMAAVLVLGRNSNGYVEWKNKDNVSLGNL